MENFLDFGVNHHVPRSVVSHMQVYVVIRFNNLEAGFFNFIGAQYN